MVQIVESLMRHKPKVCMNMVYNKNMDGLMLTFYVLLSASPRTSHQPRGMGLWDDRHQQRTSTWLYMEVVPCRDVRTLLAIIQGHTLSGTVIHSDQWSAYSIVTAL